MTFNIPPILEAQIRNPARREGRDVQSIIDEALAALAHRGAKNGSGTHAAPTHGVTPANPLRGSVLRFVDPLAPAAPESEWEALR